MRLSSHSQRRSGKSYGPDRKLPQRQQSQSRFLSQSTRENINRKMCLQRRITHARCEHSDRTIQLCQRRACPTFVNVHVRHPDFNIHLSSIENNSANDFCRSCRREGLMSRFPEFYVEEHLRDTEETRLNLGWYIVQVRARVQATRSRRREPKHIANELLAACLPPVPIDELEESDRACPICMQPYGKRSEGQHGTEDPAKLTCLHVIGRNCIVKTLDAGNGECPFCRTKIGRE